MSDRRSLETKHPTLPPGCITGVGSLPGSDPDEAVRFVAEYCPVLPFWPQLPRRHPGEGIIAQGLGPLQAWMEPTSRPSRWQIHPDRADDFLGEMLDGDGRLHPETAAGFFTFEAAFQTGDFPDAVAIKAQSVGPVTLAHCLFLNDQSLAQHPDGLERATKHVARHAVWQIRRLQRLGKPVIFVLDEPLLEWSLSAKSVSHPSVIAQSISSVLHAVRQVGALCGLHCCAPLPTDLLTECTLDFLSFDAHLELEGPGWSGLANSLQRGAGRLAFGLTPTTEGNGASPADLFSRWHHLATLTGNPAETAARTIVTATCGLGLASPATTRAAFKQCQQLGRRIEEFSRLTSPLSQ